jgi:hypothetical protein
MSLSQAEIYTLAKSVGLNDSRAKVAAAVAMAESGGDPNVHNTKPPDDSYGLWQINMIGGNGPERRKQFGISTNDALYNPTTNAKAMASISQDGGNFSAWSTYTTTDPKRSYRRFMNNAVSDQSGTPGWLKIVSPITAVIPGGNVISDTTQGITTIATAVAKSAAWLSNAQNWVRIGFVAGGTVVTIAGLIMVIQSTKTGRVVTKAATKVATKGMV